MQSEQCFQVVPNLVKGVVPLVVPKKVRSRNIEADEEVKNNYYTCSDSVISQRRRKSGGDRSKKKSHQTARL